jgi:hypothetical protein
MVECSPLLILMAGEGSRSRNFQMKWRVGLGVKHHAKSPENSFSPLDR